MANYNPNKAKINRSYTVGEVASLYSVHKNTVHDWIQNHGLKTNDNLKPILISGQYLRKFMQERKIKNKCKCLLHEIYCLKCRKPQIPDENMADYFHETKTTGRLNSVCPECGCSINRYFSLSKIKTIQDKLTITILKGI